MPCVRKVGTFHLNNQRELSCGQRDLLKALPDQGSIFQSKAIKQMLQEISSVTGTIRTSLHRKSHEDDQDGGGGGDGGTGILKLILEQS